MKSTISLSLCRRIQWRGSCLSFLIFIWRKKYERNQKNLLRDGCFSKYSTYDLYKMIYIYGMARVTFALYLNIILLWIKTQFKVSHTHPCIKIHLCLLRIRVEEISFMNVCLYVCVCVFLCIAELRVNTQTHTDMPIMSNGNSLECWMWTKIKENIIKR